MQQGPVHQNSAEHGPHQKEMGMDAIQGLHHYAYRCRDAEETRKFYEDLLGLPSSHVLYNEAVPSTREKTPHVHIFFQMPDKSFLTFLTWATMLLLHLRRTRRLGSTILLCASME